MTLYFLSMYVLNAVRTWYCPINLRNCDISVLLKPFSQFRCPTYCANLVISYAMSCPKSSYPKHGCPLGFGTCSNFVSVQYWTRIASHQLFQLRTVPCSSETTCSQVQLADSVNSVCSRSRIVSVMLVTRR